MSHPLSQDLGVRLLRLAREAIGVRLGVIPEIDRSGLDGPELQEHRGTFVTLKLEGRLRGCIGNIEPAGTIAEAVERNALNAAFQDYRFSPLTGEEFAGIQIELSILSAARPLAYRDPAELHKLLRPGVDGVILSHGRARATFLPQVWEQLPGVDDFLGHLCLKAGLNREDWKTLKPELQTYQVQHFGEEAA